MRRALGGLLLSAALLVDPVWAQQAVYLNTQVCSNASGVQVCSWAPISSANPFPTSSAPIANVTLNNCSGAIASGGVAQNAFAAQTALHGFTIMNTNGDVAVGSGEDLWMSLTTTAAASSATSYRLIAPASNVMAGSFTAPPGMAINTALSVIGATTGHRYTCTWW